MSKRNWTVDSKELAKLEKEALKVKRIQDKIKMLKKELYTIRLNNNWLCYLGSNSTKDLSEAESIKLDSINNVLIYAEDLRF